MDIGKKIQQIRKEKGMTQQQLADKAGIARSRIGQYESGARKEPKLDALTKIANALDVGLADLIPEAEKIRSTGKDSIIFQGSDGEISVEDFDPDCLGKEEKLNLALGEFLNRDGIDEARHQIELLSRIPDFQKEE